MQRIDENTYIDDTLVACSDYQLFIDEMREQGKYCQPDHWTSYQYPEGQAHKPILGVRYSDAIAFCEWLTKRENGDWRYHLLIEAKEYPLKPDRYSLPLGYWNNNVDNQYQFAWVGSVPADARDLAFDHSLALTLEHSLAHNRTRALDLERTLNRARALALDLEDLEHALDRILDRARTRALNRIFTFAFAVALERERERKLLPERDRALDLNLSITLDTYIDLFTLQERIAGRSPAFEGIRLVKERIK